MGRDGKLITDLEHLRVCVRDIVFTPLGSRLMRRDYGSKLPFLVGRPETDTIEFASAVIEALDRWEPRLDVEQALVSRVSQGRVSVAVTGIYKPSGQRVEVDL